jgi:site-specific DNA-methyltransferase (adenine-specific)
MIDIYHGDCLEIMATLDANSIDAIVTDPPYGLAFMGKRWDYDVPSVAIWAECLRVLKPGGHLLAFAGTRTQHRMAVRIEDAGFEIRDMIAWVYGSGFPKSLDVSKAIDKAAGTEREVVGIAGRSGSARACMAGDFAGGEYHATAPATPEAQQWAGWGTALKPALEPITMARKPLTGTVAANVLEHGTGAINVDGCRVAHGDDVDMTAVQRQQAEGTGIAVGKGFVGSILGKEVPMYKPGGRWPANLIHDGSEEVVRLTGSAARFFYCAKASKRDRNEGLETFDVKRVNDGRASGLSSGMPEKAMAAQQNHHPTVKPTDLMRYLCRLVTPPGGVVLDPFMGSGSTGKAAMLEGFGFIGIEREADYVEIARARCKEGGLLANAW